MFVSYLVDLVRYGQAALRGRSVELGGPWHEVMISRIDRLIRLFPEKAYTSELHKDSVCALFAMSAFWASDHRLLHRRDDTLLHQNPRFGRRLKCFFRSPLGADR